MPNDAINRIAAALMQSQGLGTGANPQNDQGIFQAPPNAASLPPIVDPGMWADPSQLPGDYARLPFDGQEGQQGVPPWAFGLVR